MAAVRTDYLPRLALERQSNNLRPLTDTFVGRERELGELAALLQAAGTRLVTILAPGGYGKSRLASELCSRLLGRFGEGVFEVRLARLGAAQRIAEAVATATGLQLAGNRDAGEQVLDYLREKEVLLHIENFEHLIQGVQFLQQVLDTAPRVRLLVTSRLALEIPAEQTYRLLPLQTGAGSDSVYLFATRALRVLPSFSLDPAAAAEADGLCSLLCGVPLAIELAAAWLDRASLPELQAALRAHARQSFGDAELSAEQAVRLACSWSWSQLDPAQRTALMQLATFRGGFFTVEAQALLGLAGARIETLLAELTRRSWLDSFAAEGRPRYTIRNVASREYAWEQLAATRDGAGADPVDPARPPTLYARAVATHARCFAELVAVEGEKLKGWPDGGQTTALHRLKLLEKENILAALDSAVEFSDLPSLLLLARHLGRLMEMTSEFILLQETYTKLLASALRLGSLELELAARGGLCAAAYHSGRYDDCDEQARAVEELGTRLDRTVSRADAKRARGLTAYTRGQYQEARALLLEALDLSREAGDRFCEASVLNNLANVEVQQRTWPLARGHYQECLELRREIGDRYGEAMVLNNLGNLEQREGRVAEGLQQLEQCLAIRREICDMHGQAAALGNVGIALYTLGEVDRARDSFRAAHAIQRSLGDRLGIAGTLNNLGAVERGKRDFAASSAVFRQAVALSREIGYGVGEATALLNLANAQALLGEQAAARQAYAETLQTLLRLGGLNLLPKAVALAGALLTTEGASMAAAQALHGGVYHCPGRHCRIDPDEQELIDGGWDRVNAALSAGQLNPAQLAAVKLQAEGLSVEELAGEALAALGVLV
jgi:tetratricopeptide (TPR) repeat protein